MSAKYGVQIIFTPQSVDIRLLALEMQRVLVFAQHMDSLEVGRGIGSVLPEAVKAAGAAGVLLKSRRKKTHNGRVAAHHETRGRGGARNHGLCR